MPNKLKQGTQPVMAEARRCLYCVDAPCAEACPSGVRPGQFIRHLVCGDIRGAKKEIKDANPLGGVCGYVCPSEELCQEKCTRASIDRPVLIRELQRYVCDNADYKIARSATNGKSVAIVGAGPAGISCASVLASRGVSVDVYDKNESPGGLVRSEIPEYRVPDGVLRRDIEESWGGNVKYRPGNSIEAGDITTLENSYDAVFLCTGLTKDRDSYDNASIAGRVATSSQFLSSHKCGKMQGVSGVVLVIGGGDAAIDVAETALRRGADRSVIVYRRSRAELPATSESLLDAVSSGVEILYNTSLAGIDGGSRIIAKLVQNKLGEAGGDGRRSFEPVQGSDFSMACDFIVFAIGKVADYELMRACGARCALDAGGEGLDSGADSKVFAGGDLTNGGATVVEAVRHGKAAAMSILEMFGLREASR